MTTVKRVLLGLISLFLVSSLLAWAFLDVRMWAPLPPGASGREFSLLMLHGLSPIGLMAALYDDLWS